MALSRGNSGALTVLVGAACLAFGFAGFAVAVPWTHAVMSVSEAAQQCPGPIDPAWPAVFCSHARPQEWKYGLIEDHQIRFAAAWVQTIVGLGGFLVCAMRLKRYR